VCNIRGVRAAGDRRYAAETEELDYATEHTEGKKNTRPSETQRRGIVGRATRLGVAIRLGGKRKNEKVGANWR